MVSKVSASAVGDEWTWTYGVSCWVYHQPSAQTIKKGSWDQYAHPSLVLYQTKR